MKHQDQNINERYAGYQQEDAPMGIGTLLVLKLLCCGGPLLVFALLSAGLSAAALWATVPYLAGAGAVVGPVLLWRWYRRRQCGPDGACTVPPSAERQRRMDDADQPDYASQQRSRSLHMEER
ncbi:MAG TPA: hypothetical protein VLA19_28735 [Herpetosiphonaceae bacterium]|nr:hypothetical protein [Herpetosiphonaceae bacterium]